MFVASSGAPPLAQVLAALEDAPVLTVGEGAEFADQGGMIAFQLRDEVVRFDVNVGRVEGARLRMSSQLIRLAQRVIGGRAGGPGC